MRRATKRIPPRRAPRRDEQSTAGKVASAVLKSTVVAALGRELVRGVFGVLGSEEATTAVGAAFQAARYDFTSRAIRTSSQYGGG